MVKSRGVWLLSLVCAIGGVAAILSAQTRTTPPSVGASHDELVAEIRGLRADLNHALTGSIRAQLLVARLQLQEQRVNTVQALLADARRSLLANEEEQTGVAGELRNAQEALRTKSFERAERAEAEEIAARMEADLVRAQTEALQLRTREAELSSQLASEQGRWIDFNDRLNEIERSLPQRTAEKQ
jgi:hypothetical protein